MEIYKYQGAGNDFVVFDNRDGKIQLTQEQVARLCDRHYGIGGDGVMLLESAQEPYGFNMVYYNSDGSTGMMCGNGSRCIVAFAKFLGITNFNFLAADGPHVGEIISSEGNVDTVRVKLKEVDKIENYQLDFSFTSSQDFSQSQSTATATFMDTGTRHLVVPVEDIDNYPVVEVGQDLRYNEAFGPIGTNVNFTEYKDGTLHVRTYEKGVEDETCACGTGITASAIAYWHSLNPQPSNVERVRIPIRALHDRLAVDFIPTPSGATDVWLTGPATRVFQCIMH